MECAKIRQLLPKYLDRSLNEQQRAIVAGHLGHCKFCPAELASLKTPPKQPVFFPTWIKVALIVAAGGAAITFALFAFKSPQTVKEVIYMPPPTKPKVVYEKEKIKEEPIKITPKENVAKTAAPSLEIEPKEKFIELAMLIKAEAPERKDIISTEQVRLTDILSMIKNRISILEGKIISVEYKENTKVPQYVTAEIPSKNYKTFLQQLDLYGVVESPPEATVPLTKESVSIKIKLVYSEKI